MSYSEVCPMSYPEGLFVFYIFLERIEKIFFEHIFWSSRDYFLVFFPIISWTPIDIPPYLLLEYLSIFKFQVCKISLTDLKHQEDYPAFDLN